MNDFTEEEIEYYKKELKIADEWQRRNGNRFYSTEEILEYIDELGREAERKLKLLGIN